MADIFEIFKRISKKEEEPSPVTHLVVGLGNPGAKYQMTRHNAGFMALSYLSQKENIKINKLRFKSLTCDHYFGGVHALFMLPQTFMNFSGDAVSEAADYYNIPVQNIIVISDDVNLAVGKMRIRGKGSSGGQKGLGNIIERLNSDGFPRIRIGVGARPENIDMVDWVLGKIPEDAREDFYKCIENSYDAVKCLLAGDLQTAMNRYN